MHKFMAKHQDEISLYFEGGTCDPAEAVPFQNGCNLCYEPMLQDTKKWPTPPKAPAAVEEINPSEFQCSHTLIRASVLGFMSTNLVGEIM